MSSPDPTEKRLFFALMPMGLKENRALLEVFKKIKVGASQKEIEAKWIKPELWHVTTHFLGPTQAARVAGLIELAKQVASRHAPFELHLRNVSGFPGIDSARVVWVGVAKTSELSALQSDLADTLATDGVELSREVFVPHMTIGRLRHGRNIKDLISPVVRREIGKFRVEELVLFESQVFGQNVVYTPQAAIPLG